MISRRALAWLVAAACVLPIAIVVVLGVSRLLGAMEDKSAPAVLDRVALALGMTWGLDLICLLLAQAINSLGPPCPPSE